MLLIGGFWKKIKKYFCSALNLFFCINIERLMTYLDDPIIIQVGYYILKIQYQAVINLTDHWKNH
jgi:hypothetical protein